MNPKDSAARVEVCIKKYTQICDCLHLWKIKMLLVFLKPSSVYGSYVESGPSKGPDWHRYGRREPFNSEI